MVAYRETVAAKGLATHTFDREIGGRRQFAGVTLEISPRERSAGNRIEFGSRLSALSEEFRSALEQGIQDGLVTGVLARFPLTDVDVRVTGCDFDPAASTEVAFRTAAVMAFREAVGNAQPELLEPVMELQIVTPSEYMGDVIGDLNGRRGKVREMTAGGTTHTITAEAPLAELFGYSTVIRSLTRGRASYALEPKEFAVVPRAKAEKLLDR
jgi:elongation factor G